MKTSTSRTQRSLKDPKSIQASMLEENPHLHERPEREAVANDAEAERDDEV